MRVTLTLSGSRAARRLQASVGHRTAGMLPGKVLCLKRRTDFLAGVTGVPLVHDISERSKLIVPFESIHAVVQSNQPGIVLPQHFHIGADLQIVTTKTAHILYDNDRDSIGFDFGNHLLKSGSVELRTRDTIIREVDAVGKTVLFGVVLQYALLVGDALDVTMAQRSELDYLIYNDPLGYADLILNGDPEGYLKDVAGRHKLED